MLRLEECRNYESHDFRVLPVIGSGEFASVHAAYWKNTQSKFAIKKFDKISTEKEIINEINLMKMVDFHPNIIKFCGIIKDETNYSLVLEYADSGTLGKYLMENATTIKWESQLKFAKEIASGVLCLHDNEIIHRDLHPNNILVHQHTIKITDFGRSCLQGSACDTKAYGVIPYMDPQILDPEIPYNLTKKSDIYSLGVLFWQLTSCSSPFNFETRKDYIAITLAILNGVREKPIPNTNVKFIELYQKCWRNKPDERPEINQVISELNNVNPEINFNFQVNELTEELKNEDGFSDCDLSNY
ncbi:unnamed protein product [Rhizophagus irregularis]|uniref:Protein kinase domain-containing protein n=1 Tax=Rhizophagus irregularis TaxID=588596 RepID=A0A915Z453_9GLOM|nr:unnamed protein product [Rhizophagus irregularis]